MTVGLVIVSHVAELADGVRVLAAQMAPDAPIVAAGGTDDGRIGTSFGKILAAVTEADKGSGVVVLFDLGSAQLTAELVAEMLPNVRVTAAPVVEGAVAASVIAQSGGTLDDVETAARTALSPAVELTADSSITSPDAQPVSVRVVLRNPTGLHARPAAELTRVVGGLDAHLTVGRPGRPGLDVMNVIGVVALGIGQGDEAEITATGPDANAAVEAALALVDQGFGELDDAPSPSPSMPSSSQPSSQPTSPSSTGENDDRVEAGVLRGFPASPGLVLGPIRRLRPAAPDFADPAGGADAAGTADAAGVADVSDSELELLGVALAKVDQSLASQASGAGARAQIAGAHRAFLSDPTLRRDAEARIGKGVSAARAWWDATAEAGKALEATGRAADLEDLGHAVLRELGYPAVSLPDDLDGVIVAADDLLPSQLGSLIDAGVEGVALAAGGTTSHVAIIARGVELPMVVRVGQELWDVADGTEVVLDAMSGALRLKPSASTIAEVNRRRAKLAEERKQARLSARERAPGGVLVTANVGSLAEARAAVADGADGIGLLRTELLFADRKTLPSMAEQRVELAEILTVVEDRPVTVRTLDIGGDKLLPALDLDPIRNGPLGERGLRYSLRHLELLETQLRAILRAAKDCGRQVAVMAPMVTTADEARAFRRIVEGIAEEAASAVPTEIGVMIEVPAAALDARSICEVVDFVSIGTNDLTQYLLAADRTLDVVSDLYRSDHPAVWHCISRVLEAAAASECTVAVCGELAASDVFAVRIKQMGVAELSMAPASIPAVKAALRASAHESVQESENT